MATADEIAVKLGLNATEFKAALKSAGASVQEFKKQADPTSLGHAFDGLSKKLINLKNLGGALAIALGINFQAIAEHIARLWTGLSKDEEERLKALVESTDKAADAQEKQLEKAKEAAVKRADDESERVRKQQELVWEARLKYFEEEKKWREDMAELAAKGAADEKKQILSFEEQLKKLKFDALPAEEKLVQLKARQYELANQLAIDKSKGINTAEIEVELQKNLNEQVDITTKKYHALTDQMKQAQASVEAADEAQAKMNLLLNDTIILMGKAYGTSRDPQDIERASEAELKDLIAKNQNEISNIEANKGRGATALTDIASNFLPQGIVIDRLKTDIMRAQFQIDQRRNIRNAVAQFGESGARARFGGDPLAFDNLLSVATSQKTEQTKGNELLADLNSRLDAAGLTRR